MKKRRYNHTLIVLMALLSIGAFYGGTLLILYPSGSLLGIPLELLSWSIFPNYLVPGLFLFFVLGVMPVIIIYGLVTKFKPDFYLFSINKKYHWSLNFSIYVGIILILSTSILTHSNPYFIGLAYISALLISHESLGHFNPLFLFMQYLLGRIPLNEFLKFLSVQLIAVIGFVIAYKY